jgi:hypothetical protein
MVIQTQSEAEAALIAYIRDYPGCRLDEIRAFKESACLRLPEQEELIDTLRRLSKEAKIQVIETNKRLRFNAS